MRRTAALALAVLTLAGCTTPHPLPQTASPSAAPSKAMTQRFAATINEAADPVRQAWLRFDEANCQAKQPPDMMCVAITDAITQRVQHLTDTAGQLTDSNSAQFLGAAPPAISPLLADTVTSGTAVADLLETSRGTLDPAVSTAMVKLVGLLERWKPYLDPGVVGPPTG